MKKILVQRRHLETILLISVFLSTAHMDSIANNDVDSYFPLFCVNYSAFTAWLMTTFFASFVYLFDSADLNLDGVIDEDSDPLLYKLTTYAFCSAMHQTLLSLIIGATQYLFTTQYFGWILTTTYVAIYIGLGCLTRKQYKGCISV